jgi:aldehyde:ferredoxin oxidoreductase
VPFGYHGRILHVDLTTSRLEVEQPDEAFYRHYMGGSALGAYYLLKNTPPGVDPLGPENTLAFSLSVLTGAAISGLSRLTVTAKSPQSGAIGDSQSGGFFPAQLKFAGFDAVIVTGRASEPVYLWLHDGQAELRPAGHLWGKITGEVERLLKDELGDDRIEVLQIGPGGENLVRFASIMSMSNRANGRTGMGAVMGAKKLKAIVARGQDRPPLADRRGLVDLARWGAANLEESALYGIARLGTAGILKGQHASGGLPTRNWTSGSFESGWQALDGITLANTILVKRDTCYACTVRCKRVVEITDGPFRADPFYGGPEYETLSMFGSNCGVDDLAAVSRAHELCATYGIDTISCGATIAWAMDCYERGLITQEDTGGIDLRFGNAAAMVQMVELIARREGFGAVLAEGSARAAQQIGNGTEELVVTVKKQELPAHMPQVKRSLGLIYAVNPFGADHESSQHDPNYAAYPDRMAEIGLVNPVSDGTLLNEKKVRFALITEYEVSAIDTLNACQFVFGPSFQLYSVTQLAEAVQAITGWDVTVEELLEVGARRLNLLRVFNAREGFERTDDVLPAKLNQPLTGGKSDGLFVTVEELERAKDQYYEMAGWDITTGNPTRSRLIELGLDWLIDEPGIQDG